MSSKLTDAQALLGRLVERMPEWWTIAKHSGVYVVSDCMEAIASNANPLTALQAAFARSWRRGLILTRTKETDMSEVKNETKFEIFTKCPECGGELIWIWGVERKIDSAHQECKKCNWWSGSHITISAAFNGMQTQLAKTQDVEGLLGEVEVLKKALELACSQVRPDKEIRERQEELMETEPYNPESEHIEEWWYRVHDKAAMEHFMSKAQSAIDAAGGE